MVGAQELSGGVFSFLLLLGVVNSVARHYLVCSAVNFAVSGGRCNNGIEKQLNDLILCVSAEGLRV